MPHKQKKVCYRKNTLLLVLYFGASVASAELPFENPALDELSDEDREEITEELEEVENDPFFLEPPSGPPAFTLTSTRGKVQFVVFLLI